MTEAIEKTISAALPSFLSAHLGSGGSKHPSSSSKAFQAFVKRVNAARSQNEERELIDKELERGKQWISQPGQSTASMHECLTRLLFCHMLGYDISFACVTAVKLAQQGKLHDKRMGYILCNVLLERESELVVLLVNTILKDLQSKNVHTIKMGLAASGHLMRADMIPAILPAVQSKLQHADAGVRQRSLLCLLQLQQYDTSLRSQFFPQFQHALKETHPLVLSAALHVALHVAKTEVSLMQPLMADLIRMEEHILNRCFVLDEEHHSVPAPWIQITLLQILGIVGCSNLQPATQIYTVLQKVLLHTDASQRIGLAVVYQCLQVILSLSPEPALMEHAAGAVAKLLASRHANIKYAGLKTLAMVVAIDTSYALKHQDVILECLDHEDESLRTRTRELLLAIINADNVQVIVARLITHLPQLSPPAVRAALSLRLLHAATLFNSDRVWFWDTISVLLLHTGRCADSVSRLIQILQQDEAGKVYAATSAWDRLSRFMEASPLCDVTVPQHEVPWLGDTPSPASSISGDDSTEKVEPSESGRPLVSSYSPALLQLDLEVMAQFAGNMSSLCVNDLVSALCRMFLDYDYIEATFYDAATVSSWLLECITHLLAQHPLNAATLSEINNLPTPNSHILDINHPHPSCTPTLNPFPENQLSESGTASSQDTVQRLRELHGLVNLKLSGEQVGEFVCTPVDMDLTLSFLDGYVSESLEHGASPYTPRPRVAPIQSTCPTATPLILSHHTSYSSSYLSEVSTSTDQAPSTSSANLDDIDSAQSLLPTSNVPRVWGRMGVITTAPSQTSDTSSARGSKCVDPADVGSTHLEPREDTLSLSKDGECCTKSKLVAGLFAGIAGATISSASHK